MEWWQAAVLGLVEGITEYLPISSTGHLILASSLMGLDDSETQKRAVDAFNIVVQGGAILAVLGLYWPRVVQMIRGLLGQDKAGLGLAINIIIAFIPAAALGVPLNDWIEAKLFSTWPVLAALALGGVYMMLLDRLVIHPKRSDSENQTGKDITDLTWRGALAIGLMQCVAMWPGTSRSMMTITGGVIVGLKPKEAAPRYLQLEIVSAHHVPKPGEGRAVHDGQSYRHASTLNTRSSPPNDRAPHDHCFVIELPQEASCLECSACESVVYFASMIGHFM